MHTYKGIGQNTASACSLMENLCTVTWYISEGLALNKDFWWGGGGGGVKQKIFFINIVLVIMGIGFWDK